MQPVGVVVPGNDEPVERSRSIEDRATVDADVAARHVVVLVRERPVDELGSEARHGHRHRPARAKNAGELAHRAHVVGDVLEDLRTDHPVEGRVGERQRAGRRPERRPSCASPRRARPRRPWRRTSPPRPSTSSRPASSATTSRAAARRFERVATEPAAEVEHRVAASRGRAARTWRSALVEDHRVRQRFAARGSRRSRRRFRAPSPAR